MRGNAVAKGGNAESSTELDPTGPSAAATESSAVPPAPDSHAAVKASKRAFPAHRRTALTPELMAELVGYVGEGLPISSAATLAGVYVETMNAWMRQGAREDDTSGIHTRFYLGIKAARVKAERESLAKVRGAKEWQGAAWYLERTNYKRYGRKSAPVEVTGAVSVQHTHTVLLGKIQQLAGLASHVVEAPLLPPPGEVLEESTGEATLEPYRGDGETEGD